MRGWSYEYTLEKRKGKRGVKKEANEVSWKDLGDVESAGRRHTLGTIKEWTLKKLAYIVWSKCVEWEREEIRRWFAWTGLGLESLVLGRSRGVQSEFGRFLKKDTE